MYKNVLMILLAGIVAFSGCRQSADENSSRFAQRQKRMVVDETFLPIVEDQLYVYQSFYPKDSVGIVSLPENRVLEQFLNDSINIAVLSRELTAEETDYYKNKNFNIRIYKFATDGLALITHTSSAIENVTVQDLIDVIQGKPAAISSLVFDNPNSSTVNFLKQLGGVKSLPQQGIYALKSNAEVIDYVHKNPGVIGVVGVNWLVQPPAELEKQVAGLKMLGVKGLPGKTGADNFYKPTQNDLATGSYPLTRSLYYMDGTGGQGFSTRFSTFLSSDRGQRIVLKSGLLPDSIPPREVIIRK